MKKLIQSSLALLLLSLSIIVFQISCQKSVEAQSGGSSYTLPPATATTLGGIIVGNGLTITNNGTLSTNTTSNSVIQLNKFIYTVKVSGSPNTETQIWIANYDGTSKTQVNVTLPNGRKVGAPGTFASCAISPDGQKVFFNAFDATGGLYLYSCNVNGSNPTELAAAPVGADAINIGRAY